MKLLLTSAGLTTQAIANELYKMIGDGNKKVGFITTAANVEPGNKDWYINQILNLRKYQFNWIDCIDPSAKDVDWITRLEDVGVIFVSGGNTFHLLNQMRKTGFNSWLRKHIEGVVYVGASAGSIVMTPTIGIAPIDDGDENLPGISDLRGLNFVDFEVSPHTPEAVSITKNEEYAMTIQRKLYAFNDRSALSVIDGRLEVIHDGSYLEFN